MEFGGRTPLHIATYNLYLDMISILLFTKIELDKTNKKEKILQNKQKEKPILYKLTDPWTTDAKGNTALHNIIKQANS